MRGLIRVPKVQEVCKSLARVLPCNLSLHFYGVSFEVWATSWVPLAYLERVYAYFLHARDQTCPQRMIILEEGTKAHQDLVRQLRPRGQVDGDLLVADWFGWGLVLRREFLLHYYASKLLRLAVIERLQSEFLTVHSASVVGRGLGLLLIGEAASGKTSLTLKLIDRGFRYCADDASCIRKSDLVCVPFPMPFLVREDPSTKRPPLTELQKRAPDIQIVGEPRWLVERWESVASEFRPNVLVFLGAEGMPPGELRKIPATHAVVELLRNTVFPLGADLHQIHGVDLDLIANLVENAYCFEANTQDTNGALHNMLDRWMELVEK